MKPSINESLRQAAAAALLFAPALAFAYPGQQLLQFGANYIIAPLGLFALVIALAGSFFRPDMVRSAIYAVIICAVLFFVISQADSLMSAVKS
jgi:hypothetical protein